MVLRASVARSASSDWKLCTGNPSAVSPVVCLVTAAWRALRLRHHAGTTCLGGLLVVIVEQHRRQALAHVPFEVIGQHAEKHMPAHPIGQPVMHRTDLQIDGLDAAKGALHQGQGLVAAHRLGIAQHVGGEVRADDIQAIGCRLGGDLGGLAGEAEGRVSDVEIEMLAHLVGVEHRADRERDLGGTAHRIALARQPRP